MRVVKILINLRCVRALVELVCLRTNVAIVQLENAYSLLKKVILKGFRTPRCQQDLLTASFAQSSNLIRCNGNSMGWFTRNQASLLGSVNDVLIYHIILII